jgi:hypothetical protein
MKVHFKLTEKLRQDVLADLRRDHPFAAERLGFFRCKASQAKGELLVLVSSYVSVPDDQYVDDASAGCFFDAKAMRTMLQHSLTHHESIFHVHLHDHSGLPQFSRTDTRESAQYVPDFWNVTPDLPHGTIVLSQNRAVGQCWYPGLKRVFGVERITAVGPRIVKLGAKP